MKVKVCDLLARDEFKEKVYSSSLDEEILQTLAPIVSFIDLNDRDWGPAHELNDFMVVIRALWKKAKGDIEKICDLCSKQLGEIELFGCKHGESLRINDKHYYGGDLVAARLEKNGS